jgi:hypothetical protein
LDPAELRIAFDLFRLSVGLAQLHKPFDRPEEHSGCADGQRGSRKGKWLDARGLIRMSNLTAATKIGMSGLILKINKLLGRLSRGSEDT